MSQSRLHSLYETVTEIAIGFVINTTANLFILPLFGFVTMTPMKSLGIAVVYTVIALIRKYTVRRWFNRMLDKRRLDA